MTEFTANRILHQITHISELYHRLILVVGLPGSGKTRTLTAVQAQISAPLININLELSRCMLDLTERQWVMQAPHLLEDILQKAEKDIVILDNLELLFDPVLKQDPLRLLQGLSRKRTIVAAWNGITKNDSLIYAEPGHPEYRRYPLHDLIIEILESEE